MNSELKQYIYQFTNNEIKVVSLSLEMLTVLQVYDNIEHNLVRQDKRYTTKDRYIENMTEYALFEPQRNSQDFVEHREMKCSVQRALKQLTAIQARRVKMYYWDELTLREIAEIEGKHHDTIYESIQQALKKMRNYFT